MVATGKRKRAKSQLDGKRGDTGNGNGNGNGKSTRAGRPIQLNPPPQRKKARSRHPAGTQVPVSSPQSLPTHHPVLSIYFPILLLLRTFLEQNLAFSPKLDGLKRLARIDKETDSDLSFLLDTTLVGLKQLRTRNTILDIQDATQSSGGSYSASSQSEIVDLTLHTLFYRSLSPSRSNNAVYPGKPNNILAQGYSLNNNRHAAAQGFNAGPFGIDVVNFYPNTHISTLKSPMWARLLKILGDEIMLDLLLNTSIFLLLDGNLCDVMKATCNYYQLAGPPLSDYLNSPAPVATRATSSLQRSSVAEPRTRPAGAPLKRPVSEIERTGAKLTDKKIKSNRPAAMHLTNRNTSKNKNGAGRNSDDSLQHPSKRKSQNTNMAVARDLRTLGEIAFVRSRMFYSKPAYNAHGEVLFGLRHIHVLNRSSDANVRSHTVHVLKHIFPRQFNLHNVFTSKIDRKETVQAFKDYTLREQEIAAVNKALKPEAVENIPKRLRGTTFELVARMQRLHKRCSYHALVKYYCPAWLCDEGVPDRRVTIPNIGPLNPAGTNNSTITQANFPSLDTINTTDVASASEAIVTKQKEAFADFASNSGEVSAFARAVIGNVIPREFWGMGDGGELNRKIVMNNVDRFVKLRRFESFSLHEVMQELKLTEFHWLCPPGIPATAKLSFSDTLKRRELLSEFLYWLFDSFLIPLLRAHFYITESNVHRNRIFYFRHDVWRKLAEPVLNRLKTDMFAELKTEKAKRILDQRKLGFTQVRLLPKDLGVRPIMNLRRRELKVDKRKGKRKMILAPSINSVMTPVHNVLSFEKSRKADKVGSSMGSVAEIYVKLKSFQTRLKEKGWLGRKLYFAKVDIKSCFDTIPQKKLLKVIESIITEDEYRIEKYAEIKPPVHQQTIVGAKKPMKKFLAKANLVDEFGKFEDRAKAEIQSGKKKNTVFVDDVVHQFRETGALLDLLEEHVQYNIIKIGKKYFRQKDGIPQGSVLSATLCNFFYGDLEKKKLSFTMDEDGILLRLVDDFLFITLNRGNSEEFLKAMHQGHPEYGAFVSVDKTLVNFDISLDGKKISRSDNQLEFPYCGNLIHTKTLGVKKDRDRGAGTNINDLLTVSYSKGAGRGLHRKAISAFKILTHPMYYDIEFNGYQAVLKNIYHSFMEAAMKFHRAVKALTGSKRPMEAFLIKVMSDFMELAVIMLKSSIGKSHRAVTRAQIRWLGAQGFKKILGRKQTKYPKLLSWLDDITMNEKAGGAVARVPFTESNPFQTFRY